MNERVEYAQKEGKEKGYQEGREQKFHGRGLMCFALSCAGDYVSSVYARSYLAGFQQALNELREEGVKVNDPRDTIA